MQLGADKASYIVSHGLGPHFHNKLIRDIKNAETFVLGTDGSTFKVGGLSKHVDVVIRYWSEEFERVADCYVDTHSFGREPAEKQVSTK